MKNVSFLDIPCAVYHFLKFFNQIRFLLGLLSPLFVFKGLILRIPLFQIAFQASRSIMALDSYLVLFFVFKRLEIPALPEHPSCSSGLMRHLELQTWKKR